MRRKNPLKQKDDKKQETLLTVIRSRHSKHCAQPAPLGLSRCSHCASIAAQAAWPSCPHNLNKRRPADTGNHTLLGYDRERHLLYIRLQFFHLFGIGNCCAAQAGLRFEAILLSQPPKYWDSRYELTYSASESSFFKKSTKNS